jgi:hypothetical protein
MQNSTLASGQNKKTISIRGGLLIAAAIFLIAGCAAQGAKRVPRDRFDYNAAIAQSTREQMLLNIVRSRYLEVPVFLTVSSVLTQYEYERSAGLGAIMEFGTGTTDRGTGEANLRFSERPTITYLPVEGQEFSAHLLSDVPSEIIFAAAQAGWSVDVFMRIGIQRLGAVENMSFEIPAAVYGDSKKSQESDFKKIKRFERMMELIYILSDREIIEVQQIEENHKNERYLMIAERIPEDLRPLVAEMRQLIGLTGGHRFRITDRVTNLKDDEISIQTRSVMAMMEFMARGVEVPPEHLKDGWVVDYGLQSSEGEASRKLIPFRMRSRKDRPENAFAAVRFRDHWYYIDEADIISKRALGLIIVLFRLQAPTPAGAAPILTLPTG